MTRSIPRLFPALLITVLLFSCATLDRNYGSYTATGYPIVSAFPRNRLAERGWAAARLEFDGAVFNVVAWRADSLETRLLLFQPGREDVPLGRLERAARIASAEGGGVVLAANAGMYNDDLTPVGLYRAEGRNLSPLRRGASEGNFGMLPNGVFYFSGAGFGIVAADGWEEIDGEAARFATQSGPLLVDGGVLHPAFAPDSPNRYVRSGVGVAGPGFNDTVFYAISERPVDFMTLARLFRDGLGCGQALYLDGHISRAWIPALGRERGGGPFGPILVAFDPDGGGAVDVDVELRLQFSF